VDASTDSNGLLQSGDNSLDHPVHRDQVELRRRVGGEDEGQSGEHCDDPALDEPALALLARPLGQSEQIDGGVGDLGVAAVVARAGVADDDRGTELDGPQALFKDVVLRLA